MTDVLSKLLAAKGLTRADVLDRRTRLGRTVAKRGVGPSRCLERVAELPRRAPDVDAALVEDLSVLLRRPGSTARLRPLQALALCEMQESGGLLGALEVGAGKTLVTFLAGPVMAAIRPVLLVPANLREKTQRDFRALDREWRGRTPLVMSYESLGRADHAEDLEKANPDLLIADECARLKNPRAAVTRRVARFLRAGTCKFVGLSGTVVRKSLHDWAHLAEWALGSESPMATHWPTLQEWSLAVDPDVDPTSALHPGALLEALPGEGEDDVQRARDGLRRRLRETRGCVVSAASRVGASIQMGWLKLPQPPAILGALRQLRQTWETPSGEPLAEAAAVWRVAQQLALGFYYEWDPPAPLEWLRARKVWATVCREVLRNNRRGLDSELQVVRAVDAGGYPEHVRALAEWREVRDTFKPHTVARWVTQDVLRSFAAKEPTIFWASHVEFGRELAKEIGSAYCGVEGKDERTGKLIDDFAGAIVVASIQSCGTGRNLQAWSRNVVTCAPADGGTWEQLIGRTHREGQDADVVEFLIADGCEESRNAVAKAQREARFVMETTGAQQRLLIADWVDQEQGQGEES